MVDRDLEQRLREHFRSEVGDGGPSAALLMEVSAIPEDAATSIFSGRRAYLLLVAATLLAALLAATAVGVGSGRIRLPWTSAPLEDTVPVPRAATPGPTSPRATPSPAVTVRPRPTVAMASLEVGGLTRDYTVVTPPDVADRDPLPLLLVLHASGMTMAEVEEITGFDTIALDPGAVIVYPQGYEDTWNAGACCEPANTQGVDDIAFIVALMDRMEADYPIDPDRIFILGGSNGGEMAYRAACELSGRIAAVADLVGTMLVDCQPDHPVSVIDIHGTIDDRIPYDGGADGCQDAPCPAVADIMERWRQIDGCVGDPVGGEDPLVVETTWSDCADGTAVTFLKAIGKGHDWYPSNPDDRAVTWAFFMRHPRSAGG